MADSKAKPRNTRQIEEVRWEFQRRRTGRFRLREIINFLSKNDETQRGPRWWADALSYAIGQAEIPLRNPCDFSDFKPYPKADGSIPDVLRALVDCADVGDVNRWLDAHPDWHVTWRFAEEHAYLLDAAARIAQDVRDDAERLAKGRVHLYDALHALGADWDTRKRLKTAVQGGDDKTPALTTYRKGIDSPYDPKGARPVFYLNLDAYGDELDWWLEKSGYRGSLRFNGPAHDVISGIPETRRDAIPGAQFQFPTAPTIATTPPVGANAGQQAKGITTPVIAEEFDGKKWDRDQWARNLANTPKWLKGAKMSSGARGAGDASTWNPVFIAVALYEKGIARPHLDAVFKRKSMNAWVAEWEEAREHLQE